MKHLIEYFFESDNLKDLKDKIIDKVEHSSSEKVLKKVNKFFELTEEEYETVNTSIKTYFSERCGYNEKISKTLRQKIKHYGGYKLFGELFGYIVNDDSKVKYFTSEKLLNGNDIFDEITDYAKSALKDDDELTEDFRELLKDIADFDIGGKVATGKMEFLSSMFLKDLNKKNNAGEGKVVCDINTQKYGFEYKTSGARIAGNKEESKPKSPEEINTTFINLILNEFLDDSKETDTQKNKNQYSSSLRLNKDLDKELEAAEIEKDLREYLEKLSKTENIFRNAKGNEIEKILNTIFDFNISENKFNEIILDSLLSQVPKMKEKITNEERKYLLDNYPVAIKKEISEEGKHNFKHIFLILGLCNYWNAEQWDYLVLFEKPDKKECTGKYKIITAPNKENLIKTMDNNIKGKCYSGAYPCYGNGTNSQNHAPMIKYLK